MKIIMTFLRVFFERFLYSFEHFHLVFLRPWKWFFFSSEDEKQIFMQIASVGDVNNFSWHFYFTFIQRESSLAQSANIRQDLSR